MQIAIYSTGHEIADTVADAMAAGMDCHHIESSSPFPFADTHIGYGILRKTGEVFNECKKTGAAWLEVDRGYFKPGHYDGYYRISLYGTQHTGQIEGWMLDDTRLNALSLDVRPWRGFDASKPVLVCPPTEHAALFFNIGHPTAWILSERYRLRGEKVVVREKGDAVPINFSDYSYVVTFNSSVGWQALAAGIPCVSDSTHSLIGSWFKNISLDELAEKQLQDRYKLFAVMSNLQLTLEEMRNGMLWPLISRLLSGSATTPERLCVHS